MLHWLAKQPVETIKRMRENASPQLGALLLGEDAGIPQTTDAQMIKWQDIMNAHPTISKEDALKLEGSYLYPDRYQDFGTPSEYLKGHENSHWFDSLRNLNSNPQPAEGIGNKGYLPVLRTRGEDQTTPAGTERWLSKYYPERQRGEERKAHLAGLEKLNYGY